MMLKWLRRARNRGCPLLSISTPDPQSAILDLAKVSAEQHAACWQWDCVQGSLPLTSEAQQQDSDAGRQPEDMLEWCSTLPQKAIVLAFWHAEYWQDVMVRQGLLNLRDKFKMDGRTLVLIGRHVQVPASLHSDFLHFDDKLPDTEQLQAVLSEVEQNAGCKALTEEQRSQAIDALRGMTAFEAEQHAAMAAAKQGIDIAALWQAKIGLINSTPGMQCWQGGEQASDVAGLEGILSYLGMLKGGKLPVRLVVWVDESEDMLAGTEGDTSGISQDYLGRLAGHIQDTRAQCLLLYGHPGTGKSLTAKAAGDIFECLVLALDLGACKGSLVGESETNLRHALAVERAIVGNQQGSTLWIWTSNNADALPAKLRSRMQAEFFTDLPDEQGQLAIWSLYRHKYAIDPSESYPDADGWVGREIERCCRLAWQFGCTLKEASKYVVPSNISHASQIAERRKRASGKYLDASKAGVFQWAEQAKGRHIDMKG